jgi:hypothetical protein
MRSALKAFIDGYAPYGTVQDSVRSEADQTALADERKI